MTISWKRMSYGHSKKAWLISYCFLILDRVKIFLLDCVMVQNENYDGDQLFAAKLIHAVGRKTISETS